MKVLQKTRNQTGSVLLLSLVATAIVGVTLAAYLTLVKSQNQNIARSQVWNSTIPLIEAGMEEAVVHLNAHGTTNLLCDGWTLVGGKYVGTPRAMGDGYYVVCIYNWTPSTNLAPVIESRAFMIPPVTVASTEGAMVPMIAAVSVPITIPDRPTGMLGRGVRATAGRNALFAKGLVAKGRIDLNGKNISTDSFDSTDPAKSTGGVYDPSKAQGHGDVATDDTVINSVSVANATIHGNVSTGPNGTISVGPQGHVYGTVTDDMNVSFDAAVCPFTNGGFNAYTTQPSSLSAGLYKISNFSVGGGSAITINGDVSIWAPNGLSMSGSAEIDIAPGGKLTIYTGGPTSISGNGIVNQGDASQCAIYGLPSCTSVSYSGNAAFTGTIYAPNADFAMNGGGTGNSATYDFVGASVTKTVTMNGNFNFHYDEALRKRGPLSNYILTSWNEMNPSQVQQLPTTAN